MDKFKINHLLSTPYHPQTNGLVEHFNRTLCESLAKLSFKSNDWDLFIAPTLFAYRTTKHSTTKMEPFFLVYGRPARLPMDEQESSRTTMENDRLHALIDQVPQIRKKARQEITHGFQIRDKVLYFNVILDHSHSGKFNPKWKGPYIVQEVLPNGAYKLKTSDNQLLPTPVNGNLLKHYKELHFKL